MKIYNGDTLVLDVAVDDVSYRYRAIMGKNTLVLNFSIPKHVEIPTGSHCEFQGETYTLVKPENLKMVHTRNFEYTVEMHSSQASLSKYKLRNIVDRRLKFSMTATPREHLQMLVDNLNARESGWTAGECIESAEKLISYNHTYLLDALDQMADTFNTEWEISGKTIHLHKVEYNRDNPLSLAYGKGNGFKPGVGRTNYEDSVPTEILYVQGGDRNIDASQYGSLELLLPKSKTIRFDGVHFEDEESFNADNARIYVTDADGYSIRRKDKEQKTKAEDSLDCSEIYPHRDEKVLKVIAVDTEKNWYDVVTDAPESLDYSKYGIGGETPTIVFQDGMLAGREFDLETDDDGNILCEKYYEDGVFFGWKFQIVPATLDGVKMPGGVYLPAVDDVFRVFGIQLPNAYIEEDETKTGASWQMFRDGVKHLYDNEDAKFTFTGTLDGIWAKKDWLNIGGKIRLGGFISFTDSQFQPDPVLIRITGIKDYVNNPYSPEIELSNSTKGISVSSELNKITSNEEKTDNLFRDSLNFTKRRFRDARETIAMLEKAMLAGFTDSISPLTVQTMMMLVGDQSLQFRFVDSKTNPQQVAHNVEYDHDSKILTIDGGIIQHMTLGINSVSTGHNAEEYIFWTLPEFSSPVLTEADKKYYVYAKVSTIDGTGTFYMSETAKGMNSESGYYYLLMGLLNSEFDGDRSYVSMYGFTEILPGQITTDIIRDTGGNLIIDLANRLISAKNGARIDGNITIGPSSSGLENLSEWPDKQQQISTAQDSANNAQATANSALQTAQDAKDYIDNTLPDEIADMNARIDGVVENWFYDYTPTRSNEPAMTWIANGEEKKHVGDTFTNTQDYVDDATTPDAGKSWRWVASGSSYTWTPIADSDAVKALQQAAKAQNTADQKRRTFVTTPYTPYDVGDLWMQGPEGEIMRCIKARQTGSYAASDWDKASKYTDDTKATTALNKISDLDYLKDTFAYIVDVNGVVLGKLVAVKDDDGNVKAMINGSDLGKDTFNGYGKLLFASGMFGLQDPQTAETRIYEDGTIITKRLIAEEGGKIGDFQIASSGSGFGLTGSAQNAGTLYEYDRNSLFLPIGFYLHGTAKSEENVMNGMDRSAKIIGVPFGGLNSGDGEGMFPPVGQNSAFAVSSIEKKDTALAPVNIGIYVKASGHRDPSRNVAFKVPEGIFEGLRPSIKFSNSATVELAEFDHTVITHRSSSQTFLLPSSPKEGQHYEIIKGMDSRITINGNGKGIWTIGSGGIQESPYINNGRFRIFLDYTEDIGDVSDDGGWIMTWFAM